MKFFWLILMRHMVLHECYFAIMTGGAIAPPLHRMQYTSHRTTHGSSHFRIMVTIRRGGPMGPPAMGPPAMGPPFGSQLRRPAC